MGETKTARFKTYDERKKKERRIRGKKKSLKETQRIILKRERLRQKDGEKVGSPSRSGETRAKTAQNDGGATKRKKIRADKLAQNRRQKESRGTCQPFKEVAKINKGEGL